MAKRNNQLDLQIASGRSGQYWKGQITRSVREILDLSTGLSWIRPEGKRKPMKVKD